VHPAKLHVLTVLSYILSNSYDPDEYISIYKTITGLEKDLHGSNVSTTLGHLQHTKGKEHSGMNISWYNSF